MVRLERIPMQAFVNNVKTVVLLGVLTGLLVGIGALFGRHFILPFFIIAVVMNLGAWFFSDRIAIASMGCKEVDARTGGDLYRMVEELARRAQLPMPRVYISPHEAPNAFATGRSPSRAAVCVTQGALQILNREELEGVIGHELTHVKNRDTLTATIAAIVAGAIASVAQWGFLLGGGRGREGGHPLAALFALIFAPIAAFLVQAAVSRSREYVADAGGASLAGSPRGLMSALQRLDAYAKRIPLDSPNPALNNLFIIEPFAGRGMGRSLGNLFATHPPTEKRIAALNRLR
jgi:heat shock protein HtpX